MEYSRKSPKGLRRGTRFQEVEIPSWWRDSKVTNMSWKLMGWLKSPKLTMSEKFLLREMVIIYQQRFISEEHNLLRRSSHWDSVFIRVKSVDKANKIVNASDLAVFVSHFTHPELIVCAWNTGAHRHDALQRELHHNGSVFMRCFLLALYLRAHRKFQMCLFGIYKVDFGRENLVKN